jgi:hypothetical protein
MLVRLPVCDLVGERGVVPGLAQARDDQVRERGRFGGSRHTASVAPHYVSDVTNAIPCCGIGRAMARLYIL